MKIYYISGAGRSGSTLLDIILGSHPEGFSLGELQFLPTNGLVDEEYCSCGARVPQCPFWLEVSEKWQKERILTLEDYIRIQRSLIRNKRVFHLVWNSFFYPGKEFRQYVKDTAALYHILFEVTGKAFLVDSSKSPANILIMRRMQLNFEVIHLRRNFSGVLSSTKKFFEKKAEDGVEREIKPQKTRYTLVTYLLDNFFTVFFSIGLSRRKIKYEDLVLDPPGVLSDLFRRDDEYEKKLINRGPFQPAHLVAGNKLRMSKEINILPNLPGNSTKKSSRSEMLLVKLVDLLF